MRKFFAVLVVLLLAAGVVFAKEFEVKKKAGEYDVTVRLDKNPPVVGDNAMTIRIKDAAGKDVTNAQVKVDYSMPAMPGMPAMNYKTDAALSGSEYKAKMDLTMSGSWNIAVKITRAGKSTAAKFTVDAR